MDAKSRERLTLRSLAVGTAMVVLINVGAPYSLYHLHSSDWAIGYLPLSVVFFFFVLVVANLVLRRLAPIAALARSELMVIFVMALVGASIPTWGTASYLVSLIAAPFSHQATPENQWAEYLHPHLKEWLAPNDETALRWFYLGLPKGEAVPWHAWAGPLAWWTAFLFALFVLCHCTVVAFRRQWAQHERLSFALMEVPLHMVEEPGPGRCLPPFLRQRLFWVGFALPVFIVLWNAVSYFDPPFPTIPTNWGMATVGAGFPPFALHVNFALIGFTFFIHREVAFSIWFFVVLSMVEEGILNRLGYTIPDRECYTLGMPAIGWQSFGAMCVLVGTIAWMARRHLAAIVKGAFARKPAPEEADEMMSYRALVVSALLSLAFIVFFLRRSGLSYPVVGVFFAAVMVLYLGVTRIVMEGGLLFVRGPLIAQTFTNFALGTEAVGHAGATSLGLHYSWAHELKGFFMAASAHGARLTEAAPRLRRKMTWVILYAGLLALVVSTLFTVWMAYRWGAIRFEGWIFGRGSSIGYDEVLRHMRNPHGPDAPRLTWLGIGAAAMALLTLLRYRFAWWPIHPIGLPVAICSYPINFFVLSFFLGWASKALIISIGGVRAYARAKFFFLGIILGFFTACGASFLIDLIWFPGQGHPLYGY
ncbi:MAG: hypothetical protein FJ291_18305 [Planctomycetes bacterium]|nr:hypothetical protein [Planctomycetota bacterium]